MTTAGGGGALFGGNGDDILTVVAESTGDPIIGGYNALLVGGAGNDQIFGGPGRDMIVGDHAMRVGFAPDLSNEGSDFIDSGGNSSPNPEMIWGDNQSAAGEVDGPQPDAELDTSDEIFTGSGSALVFAGSGDDTVIIDPTVSSPPGTAIVHGGQGSDTLHGGEGNDVLIGDFQPVYDGDGKLVGQPGDDRLVGGGGDDELYGGWHHYDRARIPPDHLMGNDTLYGNDGNDLLDGIDSAFVRATGGDGNDTVLGSVGNDLIFGNDGDDLLAGGAGSDLIRGGTGNDGILGGVGSIDNEWLILTQSSENTDRADRLFGDDGDDVILGDNGTIRQFEETSQTSQSTEETWTTTRTFTNPSQRGSIDLIVGGKGDDVLVGGADNDSIFGDSDFAYFQGVLAPLDVIPDPGDDIILGDEGWIERATYHYLDTKSFEISEDTQVVRSEPPAGNGGRDSIWADEFNNEFLGGNDLVFGGEEADVIWSSAGDDIVFGDLAQRYVFNRLTGQSPDFTREHERYVAAIEADSGDADVIHGGFGSDILVGGAAGDELNGNGGSDYLFGDLAELQFDEMANPIRMMTRQVTIGGDDLIDGGDDDDYAFGGFGDDTLWAGDDDTFAQNFLIGDSGTAIIYGPDDITILSDADYEDEPSFIGGNDILRGRRGRDYAAGGPGDDIFRGGNGDDVAYGDFAQFLHIQPASMYSPVHLAYYDEEGGNDRLFGGGGFDQLHGGVGDDRLSGVAGENSLDGGDGVDSLVEEADTDFFFLHSGDLYSDVVYDHPANIEVAILTGGESDNIIEASQFSGSTILKGLGGAIFLPAPSTPTSCTAATAAIPSMVVPAAIFCTAAMAPTRPMSSTKAIDCSDTPAAMPCTASGATTSWMVALG